MRLYSTYWINWMPLNGNGQILFKERVWIWWTVNVAVRLSNWLEIQNNSILLQPRWMLVNSAWVLIAISAMWEMRGMWVDVMTDWCLFCCRPCRRTADPLRSFQVLIATFPSSALLLNTIMHICADSFETLCKTNTAESIAFILSLINSGLEFVVMCTWCN